MNKVVVFGAGENGKKALKFLGGVKNIEICAVCDNDKEKWGKKILGYNIFPPEYVFSNVKYDSIFISVKNNKSIYNQCENRTDSPIYTQINQLVAEVVYIDISSGCNAKCLYCVTGNENRNKKSISKSMSLKLFDKIYRHLYFNGMISKNSEIGLFNWGEPFLNCECVNIFKYLSDNKQKYVLSTNGSIYRHAKDADTYTYCTRIYFSMPGFSQQSYDKIHGFNFEIIKNNIKNIYYDMVEHGFQGEAIISAHMYKFSINEIDELKEWANKIGIKVCPYHPYLNGNSLFEKYFDNELSLEYLKNIEMDLFVDRWEKLKINRPQDFLCPISEWLVLDCDGNMVLCCQTDEYCNSYKMWGKIFDVDTYDAYIMKKREMIKSESCEKCRQMSIDYIVSHNYESV